MWYGASVYPEDEHTPARAHHAELAALMDRAAHSGDPSVIRYAILQAFDLGRESKAPDPRNAPAAPVGANERGRERGRDTLPWWRR